MTAAVPSVKTSGGGPASRNALRSARHGAVAGEFIVEGKSGLHGRGRASRVGAHRVQSAEYRRGQDWARADLRSSVRLRERGRPKIGAKLAYRRAPLGHAGAHQAVQAFVKVPAPGRAIWAKRRQASDTGGRTGGSYADKNPSGCNTLDAQFRPSFSATQRPRIRGGVGDKQVRASFTAALQILVTLRAETAWRSF